MDRFGIEPKTYRVRAGCSEPIELAIQTEVTNLISIYILAGCSVLVNDKTLGLIGGSTEIRTDDMELMKLPL